VFPSYWIEDGKQFSHREISIRIEGTKIHSDIMHYRDMKNRSRQLAIPRTITLQLGTLFGFFFFNSTLVAIKSVLFSMIALSCYYLCIGVQKALSKI